MEKFFVILFIISVVSCKQKKENEISFQKDFDREYFFGFDRETIIDTNLFIPDSLLLNSNDGNGFRLERYYISDSSMCFRNNNNIYIKAQYNINYYKGNYSLIKVVAPNNLFEIQWRYGPTAIRCGTDKPILTLIGRRLILNKSKYEINDTVKGKLFLKYYADYEYMRDSSERFKIEADSFLFKYRLFQGSVSIIKQFEEDYNKN
jgi:hypothetical protein